jgi:hypothetical protein
MSPKFLLTSAAVALAVVLAHQHVAAAGGVKNAARIGN